MRFEMPTLHPSRPGAPQVQPSLSMMPPAGPAAMQVRSGMEIAWMGAFRG